MLDASAMPMWDQMPEVMGQVLTLDGGLTLTADAQFGDFTYTTANGAVTITGYTGAGGAVEIPTTISGLPVTVLRGTFKANKTVTSVTIPEGVTSIENGCFFQCWNLSSVSIPEGVKSIDHQAFYYCSKLATVSIPTSVTSIGYQAFNRCTGLTSVTIPARVTSIGDGAFGECANLESVAISASVISIGRSAFLRCTSLTSVTVPASVTSIGEYGFSECAKLTSLTIPASVTSIGLYAFSFCTNLKSVYFLSSPPTIGSEPFWNSPVTVYRPDYASGWTATFAQKTVRVFRPVSAAFALTPTYDGVSISGYAGWGGELAIPTYLDGMTVVAIGTRAFSQTASITSATIPVSVGIIGHAAFQGCTGLTSVTIPGSVTSIGASAFEDCPNLSSITVTTIDATSVTSAVLVTVNTVNARVLKQGAGAMHFNTASTRTGGTVVEVGEIVVSRKDALGTGLLEVQAGAKATLQTGYDTVAVTSLTLADTARLEIGTSKLTVAANGFTESDIRSKLIAGRNGGSWDGPSGITSTFAGGDRSIGYRVADGALEVAYAAPGDSNLDGVFDILDIGDILSAGKFNTEEPANWRQGDVNYDNVFDIVDLADILGTNLFNQGSYLTQPAANSAAVESGTVATFDPALVFAALAMDSGGPTTTKRKLL